MLDFCIIGSGVSGSTIAYLLSKKYSVHILDKARGPGGRASNKRFAIVEPAIPDPIIQKSNIIRIKIYTFH